ncbi:MAG: haloacid dehalogenase type II [Alphaproteobacteria bacterium]
MTTTHYVFDAYGTVFDVHSAVARAGAALGPMAEPLSQMWRVKQIEYSWTTTLMGGFEDFWVLTGRALDFCLARFGVSDPALRAALMDAYRTLSAYPDAHETLCALKSRGMTTAIFTNGTREMVTSAIASAGIGPVLDHVVTVEAERRYKPHVSVYARALADLGLTDPGHVTFVSSNRWDVAGAVNFGFKTYWINRIGQPDEYPGYPPKAVLKSLAELVAD